MIVGQLVATRSISDRMADDRAFAFFIANCLERYRRHDWGDVDSEDKRTNDEAAKGGYRVVAAYKLLKGLESGGDDKIWIITEWDRSQTTILWPSEY